MNFSKITSGYRTKLIISAYKDWIKKDDNIIDVGCGTGIVGKILANHFSAKITGCDIKNYLTYKIPFVRIKNYSIDIKNKSYDVALLNDVLHHIDKKHHIAIIKETIRIAKRTLIFEFEPTIIGILSDIILNKIHYGDLTTPIGLRSREDWQKFFKELKLESKTIKIRKPFWYPFSHIAFLLTKK